MKGLLAGLCIATAVFATPVWAKQAQKPFATCFRQVGNYYHINPLLLRAIAEQESHYNPRALHKNTDGSWDIGVMQINSFWLPTLRKAGIDPDRLVNDPCLNIAVGGLILSKAIARYGVSWRAVGAYNAVTPWKQDRYALAIAKRVKAELETLSGPGATSELEAAR